MIAKIPVYNKETWQRVLELRERCERDLAKSGALPGGRGRISNIKGRSQVKDPVTGLWTKRDTSSGKFIEAKRSGDPFKGVQREDGGIYRGPVKRKSWFRRLLEEMFGL